MLSAETNKVNSEANACKSIVYRLIQYMYDHKMSQRDLARKLDVIPQYINKLLRGEDLDLKITTALRYGRILGLQLVFVPEAQPITTGKQKERYTDRFITQIKELSSKYHVKELYLFGSVLTSRFRNSSDIDFAVKFNTEAIIDYAENFFSFKEDLATLLNREVDMVEIDALRNQYFIEELNTQKRLIYAN